MPHIALLHADEDRALIERLRQGLEAQDFMVETLRLPAAARGCREIRDTLLMADWPVLLAGPALEPEDDDGWLGQLPVALRDLLVLHWQRPAPALPGIASLNLEWPVQRLLLAVRRIAAETGRHARPALATAWLLITALATE